ncbi:MAG: hypothetical protein Q9163_005453 [Psora crenata]
MSSAQLSAATDQTANPYRLLSQACKDNNITAVSVCIDTLIQKEPGNDAYINQWALRRALRHGAYEVVTYLLDCRNASLEEVTPDSLTTTPSIPLFEAAVAHGFDINSPEPRGESAGQRLIQFVVHDETMVQWCLDHGSSIEDGVRDPDVLPFPALLESVALSGTVSTFRLLQSRGAKMGKRTLHRAVEGAALAGTNTKQLSVRMEMVRFLVEQVGCDVNALDTDTPLPMHFGTPLAYAARVHGGGKEVVTFLLEKGADPRIKDCWGGHNALTLAESRENKDVLDLLTERVQRLETG